MYCQNIRLVCQSCQASAQTVGIVYSKQVYSAAGRVHLFRVQFWLFAEHQSVTNFSSVSLSIRFCLLLSFSVPVSVCLPVCPFVCQFVGYESKECDSRSAPWTIDKRIFKYRMMDSLMHWLYLLMVFTFFQNLTSLMTFFTPSQTGLTNSIWKQHQRRDELWSTTREINDNPPGLNDG